MFQHAPPPLDVTPVQDQHQQVQVPSVGCLDQIRPVHQRDRDPQCGPDVGRHLLLAAALAPPLLVQSRQEVTDRLPVGPRSKPGQGPVKR